MRRNIRPRYIDYRLIKLTAVIHLILGSLILILSGIVLFALPAVVFYMTFLFGLYMFVPGVVITFSLVNKTAAKQWSHYMIPFWKLIS